MTKKKKEFKLAKSR